jgi:hypothetical protein
MDTDLLSAYLPMDRRQGECLALTNLATLYSAQKDTQRAPACLEGILAYLGQEGHTLYNLANLGYNQAAPYAAAIQQEACLLRLVTTKAPIMEPKAQRHQDS